MLPEVYYTYAGEYNPIPAQEEWESDVDFAKENAVEAAQDSTEDFIVYEISVRPLFRTERTVELNPM